MCWYCEIWMADGTIPSVLLHIQCLAHTAVHRRRLPLCRACQLPAKPAQSCEQQFTVQVLTDLPSNGVAILFCAVPRVA